MKHVILISPYFTPSNLAGVQRTRLIANNLQQFGWKPIVITVDPKHYEEASDRVSLALLSNNLQIEHMNAWPAKICRLFGLGDISLRSQWTMRRKIAELAKAGGADLVFVTVLPGYASLVGAWAKRTFNLPFVLDYQDPWVPSNGLPSGSSIKQRVAHWLATKLEPGVIKQADGITAVSDETLTSLRARRLLRSDIPIEIIPIGADPEDHRVATKAGKSLITKESDEFALAYLGTITNRMLPATEALFRAVSLIGGSKSDVRLKLYFVGTSAQPHGQDVHRLTQLASECGVSSCFELEPRRIGYLDALRTMQEADALVLIGSTDSHYTASKFFPYWLAAKPIIALFHERSTIVDLARELGRVRVVTYNDVEGVEKRVRDVAEMLRELITDRAAPAAPASESAFESYSARSVAQRYATLFDRILARSNR